MAERKTEIVKARVTPSTKAQWQELAAQADISVTELIERGVERYAWELQNKMLDGTALIDSTALIVKAEATNGEDVEPFAAGWKPWMA